MTYVRTLVDKNQLSGTASHSPNGQDCAHFKLTFTQHSQPDTIERTLYPRAFNISANTYLPLRHNPEREKATTVYNTCR